MSDSGGVVDGEGVPVAAAAPAGRLTAAGVEEWIRQLAEGDLPGDDPARIELVAALERLAGAAASAGVRTSVVFDRSQRAEQAAVGVPGSRQGVGVAHQLGLARHVSPWQAKQVLGLAVVLDRELPCTAEALRYGRISQWRAMIIARESAALGVEHRAVVDREIAGDVAALEAMGDRELAGAVAGLAARLDPGSVAARRRRAEAERRVGLRPAPDTMSHLSGLLPVADGVAVFAALSAAADAARGRGDDRTRGQLMADTLVDRILRRAGSDVLNDADGADAAADGVGVPEARLAEVTWESCDTATSATSEAGVSDAGDSEDCGQADCEVRTAHAEVGVVINLVMTDQQLFGGVDGAAWLDGFGPIDAEAARELARSDRVWLRRCFSDPDSGALVGLESRSRFFPPGLKKLIRLRDRLCRTPWCDAPIRHADHVVDHDTGGPTSLVNGQGLCEACNHAKQAPQWRQVTADRVAELAAAAEQADHDRWGRLPTGLPAVGGQELVIVTPTGHRYVAGVPRHSGVPRRPREVHLGPGEPRPARPRQVPIEIIFAAA